MPEVVRLEHGVDRNGYHVSNALQLDTVHRKRTDSVGTPVQGDVYVYAVDGLIWPAAELCVSGMTQVIVLPCCISVCVFRHWQSL